MAKLLRRWLPLLLGSALVSTGFAYLDSNSVLPSNAGLGSGKISGYEVTQIHYVSNYPAGVGEAHPHHDVSGVNFVLTSIGGTGTQPAHVYAKVHHGATTSQFQECVGSTWNPPATGSTSGWAYYTCNANDTVPLHDADLLTVIAYQ